MEQKKEAAAKVCNRLAAAAAAPLIALTLAHSLARSRAAQLIRC